MPDDPDARLHDAVMAATARDHTFHETGRWRDNLRAMLAIARVGWRLRRTEKDRSTSDMSEEGSLYKEHPRRPRDTESLGDLGGPLVARSELLTARLVLCRFR